MPLEKDIELGRQHASKPSSTERSCASCIPLHYGVLLLTMMSLVTAVIFAAIGICSIARNASNMRVADLVVSGTNLTLWTFLCGICIFGLFATWREKHLQFTIFAYLFACHWLLHFFATIIFLIVAYKRDNSQTQENCQTDLNEARPCQVPINSMLIIATIGLCVYKVVGAYAVYIMLCYRKVLNERHRLVCSRVCAPSLQRWDSTSSVSSYASSNKKRKWPRHAIPSIKIDFASDQSSASSYSNDSGGGPYLEFSHKYPSLGVTSPPRAYGVDGAEDRVFDISRWAQMRRSLELTEEVPTVPKYSVIGSHKGELT